MNGVKTNVKDIKPPKSRPGLPIRTTKPGPPRRLTVLVYGVPGSGKTWFAGTFPKPLFIDVRGGVEATLRNKEIAFVQPQRWEDLIQCLIPENVKDYETVVLDTFTEAVYGTIVRSVLNISPKDEMDLKEWSRALERARTLYRGLLDIPDKHIVVTCQEMHDKDEEFGHIYVQPQLPPSMARKIGDYFDSVFHLRMGMKDGKKGRVMLTQPEGRYIAKDRWGCLDKLEIPDFNVIWDKISKS